MAPTYNLQERRRKLLCSASGRPEVGMGIRQWADTPIARDTDILMVKNSAWGSLGGLRLGTISEEIV